GTRSDTIDRPAASRSACRVALPRVENDATVSSVLVSVPLGSAAPTAITYGLAAGMVTRVAVAPSLPTATTTTMPFFQAASTAYESGSSTSLCAESVPNERLRTRMLRPASLRCCTTQSIAAITWDTSAAPSDAATLRLISLAPGAMPSKPEAG